MIDKENLEKTAAWPFLEAKKILRERKAYIEKKGKIIYKPGMAQAAYHILELLGKLPEPLWW